MILLLILDFKLIPCRLFSGIGNVPVQQTNDYLQTHKCDCFLCRFFMQGFREIGCQSKTILFLYGWSIRYFKPLLYYSSDENVFEEGAMLVGNIVSICS